VNLPETDVLIPVRLNHQDKADKAEFLERFGHAVRSAAAMACARVVVADVSRRSALDDLRAAAGVEFGYAHTSRLGQYNRSHNINFGFKRLVVSEFFLISDADLVYKANALESLLTTADEKKCVVIPRKKQVVRLWSDSWAEAESAESRLTATNGSCFLARSAFERVRGFDEGFIGWGSEDDDFYTRLGFAKIGVTRPGFASDALAIHLHHAEHHTINVQQRHANRSRRDRQLRMVADGKMKPWSVNADGWGK
jgi:GT2 family glycosyltransferase